MFGWLFITHTLLVTNGELGQFALCHQHFMWLPVCAVEAQPPGCGCDSAQGGLGAGQRAAAATKSRLQKKLRLRRKRKARARFNGPKKLLGFKVFKPGPSQPRFSGSKRVNAPKVSAWPLKWP